MHDQQHERVCLMTVNQHNIAVSFPSVKDKRHRVEVIIPIK